MDGIKLMSKAASEGKSHIVGTESNSKYFLIIKKKKFCILPKFYLQISRRDK